MIKDDAETEELLLTKAEAVALVKRSEREAGAYFLLHVPLDAGVLGEPDKVFPGGCYTSLRISKADALKVFEGMGMSEAFEARGARIRITKRMSAGIRHKTSTQYSIH